MLKNGGEAALPCHRATERAIHHSSFGLLHSTFVSVIGHSSFGIVELGLCLSA
jgi:hypothetical protein